MGVYFFVGSKAIDLLRALALVSRRRKFIKSFDYLGTKEPRLTPNGGKGVYSDTIRRIG